ncbi:MULTISPECIES: thermonuclease family protein [unclassified Xanthobacter]|uniref:thermonuclease family protein n=1 Tax=unclassified Xanthobacter TaxID=2623496 RepID=UPI001F1EDC01|nr:MULTISPECIES: thermonuclease family protein [unclassified Xanthobacter]
MKRTFLCAGWVALALLGLVPASLAQEIAGRASVIDADTLDIHGQRVRLLGIDAPESQQLCRNRATGSQVRCGGAAAFYLADLIGSATVTCEGTNRDRYGRMLAHCRVRGEDIGKALVRAGWARAYVQFSQEYVTQEEEARAAGVGVWATDFQAPWVWRRLRAGR